MSRRYFGTDGIRGRVGTPPITADFVLRLGRALGEVLSREGFAKVVIGKDTRVSGYMFESALESGLIAGGANVRLLGPMPTPAVAYLTQALRASMGIVISASHNPYEDNGIKFFSESGEKLDDELELAIEAAIERPFVTVDSTKLGRAKRVEDAGGRYIEFCKASIPRERNLRGRRIALDCAHGATYRVAPAVFSELGAEVHAIGVEPDGRNINHEVGSMHPEAVAAAVRACGAELGIAFDGDGDRLQMVDAHGELVDGDDLLYLLACDWQRRGLLRGPVVGTLMSNFGLEQALAERGIPFLRARVGDRYVHQMLRQHNAVLGGETSGHLLCLNRASTGDAIVAALQVLEALTEQGCGLREALVGLHKVPQVTENVRLAQRPSLDCPEIESVRARIAQQLTGRGRLILRPSGTEPVVRVTVEAPDAGEARSLALELAAAVRSAGSS